MKFNCPECSHELNIPDRYAGHMGTCNHCQAKIRVPSGYEVQTQKVVNVATVLMDAVAPIKSCKKCGASGGRLVSNFVELSKELYCPDCAPDVVYPCPKCTEETIHKETVALHGVHVCKRCVEKETLSCSVCWMTMVAQPTKFTKVRGVHYCNDCLKEALDSLVTLTTTPNIDGYRVKRYISIESVEYVIGTGFLSEMTSDISDFLGSRSSAFEIKLAAAKKFTMMKMKYLALSQGGNAVLGVDLDYTEFSGNRVGLILNGTVVDIEPVDVGAVQSSHDSEVKS